MHPFDDNDKGGNTEEKIGQDLVSVLRAHENTETRWLGIVIVLY